MRSHLVFGLTVFLTACVLGLLFDRFLHGQIDWLDTLGFAACFAVAMTYVNSLHAADLRRRAKATNE